MNSERERVLDALVRTAEAIALTFGGSCETLIHDMKQPGHPVIAIFNSHVSGRQPGSTASIFGDDLGEVELDLDSYNMDDAVNTLAITNSGRHIKSTSIKFAGPDYHYVLGINYDYTPLMAAAGALQDLTTVGTNLNEEIFKQHNTNLDSIFDDCVRLVGKPIDKMKKPDKLQLIALLMEHNAFNYQKAVTTIAERLGMSRFTIYKYIHELEE